jgi:hypothetical protein
LYTVPIVNGKKRKLHIHQFNNFLIVGRIIMSASKHKFQQSKVTRKPQARNEIISITQLLIRTNWTWQSGQSNSGADGGLWMPQSGELEPAAAAPMNWLPIILAMAGGRRWPPMHGGKGRRATAARAGGSRLCGRSGVAGDWGIPTGREKNGEAGFSS